MDSHVHAIRISNLVKRYGTMTAVEDLFLNVAGRPYSRFPGTQRFREEYYDQLSDRLEADDYLAAVRFLEAQSGVNPKQAGIFGHSQGATISPLIAARPGTVAFVIAAAAIGTGPLYTQDLYRTRNDLEDKGFTEPDISELWTYIANGSM